MTTAPVEPTLTHHAQDDGPELVTTSAPVIEVDGHLLKDLACTGELLLYAGWRPSVGERATNLVGRLSIDVLASLVPCSPYQPVPDEGNASSTGTYNGGKTLAEVGVPAHTPHRPAAHHAHREPRAPRPRHHASGRGDRWTLEQRPAAHAARR